MEPPNRDEAKSPRRSYANGGAVQSGYSAAENVAEATTLAGLVIAVVRVRSAVTTLASQRCRGEFRRGGNF